MACSILRNRETNEIEQVLAPNGSESLLFSELVDRNVGNKEDALREWAKVYTPSYLSFNNWTSTNEEPTLEQLDRFNNRTIEVYYSKASQAPNVNEAIVQSNATFEAQLAKIKEATKGTFVEGKTVTPAVVREILDNIQSKGIRNDYDHLGLDYTNGRLNFYNRLSPEANERAKKAVSLLEDLTTRTGLNYKIDYYLATPGEFKDGVAIVNPYHPSFGNDVVWHEGLGHPIVEAVFQQAENSPLLESLKGQIYDNVGDIQTWMENQYPEFEKGSDDYYKEAITTLLGRYLDFTNKKVNEFKVNETISTGAAIVKFLERFLSRAKNMLNSIISQYLSSTKRISVDDLKSNAFSVQELATLLGTTDNFIDLSDVKFNTKFFSKESFTTPIEDAVLSAQTQGVRETLEKQLEKIYQQASKQLKVLKAKLTPDERRGLTRVLNFLEDPKAVGAIKTFATYVTESDKVLKVHLNKAIETARLEKDSLKKLNDLRYNLQVAESYEPTIANLLSEYQLVDNDNLIKQSIQSAAKSIADIKSIYLREVEEPIVDILSDTSDQSADAILKDLDAQIEFKKSRLAVAPEGSARAIGLQKDIDVLEAQKAKFVPNKDNIRATLKGQRGDVNIVSMYLENVMAGGDAVVTSFAKMIKDKFNQVRVALMPLKNRAQEMLESYKQATGRSDFNNAKFYDGLYERVQRGTTNEEGEFVTKDLYSFLGKFNQDYIVEQQRFYHDLEQLKRSGDRTAYDAKLREFNDWRNKYMEREYTSEYYAAENLLIPEAKQAQQDLLAQIDAAKANIEANGGSVEESDELENLWRQYSDLARLYDRTGHKKTGIDLDIANSIKAFRAERAKMEKWVLTPEGQANFDIMVQRQKDRLESGYITQEQFDKWLRKNTTRRINPDFYLERSKITKRISDILSKIPKEVTGKESTDDLWEGIMAISANHRDEDRVVDGSDLSSQEALLVKQKEDKLEEIRQQTISLGGLTPAEANELNALLNTDIYEQTDETSQRITELLNTKLQRKAEIDKYISQGEYALLMRSFKELEEIQKYDPTPYYEEARNQAFNEFRSTLSDVEAMPDAYIQEGFMQSEWFKNNHVFKLRPIVDEEGKIRGYDETPVPLYIWRDVTPRDESLIDYNYPSFRYLQREVNEEYLNDNFRNSVDGYNVPKERVIEDGQEVDSKYLNQKYKDLENRAQTDTSAKGQLQMLQFLTDTYLDAQTKVPEERRMGLLLPAIEKEGFDRLQAEGVQSLGKQAWKGIKRRWTITEQDKDTSLGDVAGIEFNYIPVKYTGNISADDVSLNLTQSVMQYAQMAEQYKVLEESLPVADALERVLANEQNRVTTGKVDALLKKIGFNVEVLKRGQSNRLTQIREFIKTTWYGELQKDNHIWGINVNKVADNLMSVSALQILALNVPAHITNLISGEVQSFIEASAGKYFNREDWLRAKGIYAQNIGNFWNDYRQEGKKSLATQITELFDVPQGAFENEFGKKVNYSDIKEAKSWLFFLKNGGEHEIQVSTLIAMMKNQMVKMDDRMVPLWEAYQLDEHGDIKLKDGVEFTDEQRDAFTSRVHGVLRGLNGDYAKFGRPLIEKYTLGRLMFFMRKFLVPLVSRRFASPRLNLETETIQQGYYVSFVKSLYKDIVRYRGNVISHWGDMSDEEKQSVKRTAVDIGLILMFAVLISMLGGYDDDKDMKLYGSNGAQLAEGKFWKLHLLYQLMKVKSETENFVPIFGMGYDEAMRTVGTTSIAWRTLNQLSQIAGDAWTLGTNPDKAYYQRDQGFWNQGDMKLVARLGRLGGFSGNTFHPDQLIKNFNLGQKIK